MDAGASILAFLTAGLQSAKLAYDVVSAIKDGPQRIRDLESALGHLVTHLGYLEADPSLIPQKDAAIFQKCRDDLIQVRIDVEKLCVSDKDGKLERMWKKIKPALKEKDIAQILAKVTAQIATIGVYALVAQSTTVTEIHARQSELHKENKTTLDKQSADITGMASHQFTIHDTVMRNKTILTDIASRQTTTQETLHQQQASLAESASCQERFEDTILRDIELLLSDAAESRAILEKLSILASKTSTSSSHEDGEALAELQTSIATLKELVDEKSQVVSGEHSDSVRQAMSRILQYLIREVKAGSHGCYDLYQASAEDATQILEQIKVHFETQPKGPLAPDTLTRLNPTSMRAPSLIGEKRTWEGGIRTDFNVQQTDVCIKRSRFTSTCPKIHDVQGRETQQPKRQVGHHDTEVQSEIAIWSHRKGPTGGFILKASVVEALNYYNGARAVLAPMVSVYRIVPSNSDVFKSIKYGRLDELVSLISNGKASLRDRDEKGASLLHYACIAINPDICKFLLEHRADPDDDVDVGHAYPMDRGSDNVPRQIVTPLGTLWSFHSPHGSFMNPAAQCARYLVRHGAEVVNDTILASACLTPFDQNHLQVILSAARLTTDISRHPILRMGLFSIACEAVMPTFTALPPLVEKGASANGLFSHEPPPLVVVLGTLIKPRKCSLGRPAPLSGELDCRADAVLLRTAPYARQIAG
ncbi:hypothetical protein RB595_008974 [Gaeumannomyces hyphopodioides]